MSNGSDNEQRSDHHKHGGLMKRLFLVLNQWRPFPLYELLAYIPMFAGVPMFAYGIQPYNTTILKIILLTVATMYSGFFAALIWNDITDADIDAIVHPSRPIPNGRITPRRFFAIALVFSAFTFLFAVLVSPWCLILVGASALFVTFHDKYLKKKITLPAYSEIFTPFQWLTVPVFGFFALWSTSLLPPGDITISAPALGYLSIHSSQIPTLILLVLFTYFADDAHDLAEGIHDVEGDRRMGVRTYATSFGEKNAAVISFVMVFLSGVLGILVYLFSLLSLIFLFPFLIVWVYTLFSFYKLIVVDPSQRGRMGKTVGRIGYNYFLLSYVFLFFDVLIQVLTYSLWGWRLPY